VVRVRINVSSPYPHQGPAVTWIRTQVLTVASPALIKKIQMPERRRGPFKEWLLANDQVRKWLVENQLVPITM